MKMRITTKIKQLLILSASLLTLSATAKEDVVDISVDITKPGSELNKNIYGQFMEHLGRGIYEGIWVGKNSFIPNKEGYRLDVLQALKDLQVPLLRWPGGCFADEYHWQDGIGPRESRPKTVNSNWGGVIEDNAFGTHEFFALAEMLGAETYVNGNLGTGTAREMAEWLHYMTSDADTTLVAQRRANGHPKPFKVDYFAIGNEAWGCGGNMTPDYYSDLFKQYAGFLKAPTDNFPKIIASGGTDTQTIWTETLLEKVKPSWSLRMDAISHHYYTLPTGKWDVKGSATGFSEQEWFSTLYNTLKIEDFIQANVAIMDKFDPEKKIGFYVDEWGTWYDVDKGTNPGFLYQQNTLRDAVLTGLNIHIFNRYADRVQMTNIAQMVNVLQAMILTDKEKMVLTPTYYAFKMHIPFQDAVSLPVSLSATPRYQFDDESIPALSASAAKAKDGNTYLSLVNTSVSNEMMLKLQNIKQAEGWMLTGDKMDTHNTFEQPNNIAPTMFIAAVSEGKTTITIPAKSLIVLNLGKL
ncbi:MAG: alpha-N-arabinofuranosidase [Paraglaciecola sp.]|uniref:alpha-N-arabinofuranosidase n=1 Tax=Paraglaciecola sp. TaxID=1920173 RepID=UPI00273FAFC5|nr:alpha-L-arabinofuranosidase C-terminal domain-containing protein [Paraglaciecola sp.]MDP5030786.1 alpha-N-arabinofuranosidase [Paraglaciecola sp.]MDP5132150.1 alpha-N-arabinofuranosidase [Paraglaciecola sp.]